MIIYDNKGKLLLDIPVDDTSYRYRAIRQGDRVFLHFSLTGHVEIPLYSYIEYQGERYILWKPENLTKHFSRNIEYSVEFGGWWELLGRTRYKLLSDKPHKLRFSLSATPKTFMGLLVDNLNQHDSGWTLGVCVEASERLLSFSHESCMAALDRLADEYDTEWEITGKTISLRKVERFKDGPVALSYGRGNGFKSGVGRTNQGDKAPVTILYVQGGDRNIDRLRYGSDTLLLPRSQELAYQGRRYKTDTDGMYITRADKALAVFNEDGYDAGDIYPSRVGEVTGVGTEPGKDTEGNPFTFYDIADTTIPAALDYRDCRLDGNKATVIFQSGKLAGREFDIVQTEKDLTGYDHATRTFKLVSIQEDGMTLPNDRLCPSIGDKYAVFNISLPAAYVCDDTTKTGASWDMFREAARYMYENEDEAFRFKGDLDGIWAKRHWLEIGGKLVPGGHVDFSDGQFQPEGILIRITGIKDYINRPYSPEIELSNTPVAGLVSSELGKIDANEKTDEDNHRKSLQFTKRSFRDAKETMGMLADALLTNFTESVNPVTVATMQLLVGDESLQFRFVSGRTNPVAVDDGIRYDKGRKVLSIPAGIIQHMTLGIKDISPRHEYKFWDMGSYGSPYLDPAKKFYLYARCGVSGQSGTFLVSEKAIGMGDVPGYYHLLVGVLNGEYDGERSLTTLYGYTEVLPGRITTDRVVSTDGENYMDLANNAFRVGDRSSYLDWNSAGDGKLRLSGIITQSPSGDTGLLPTFRGDYSRDLVYYPGDEVTYLGSMYRCVRQNSGNPLLLGIKDYWIVVARKGADGNDGVKGADGKDGANGKDGIDGLPGSLPTTRQWSEGTIYYRTDTRVDYIMYRATAKDTPTWWRLRKGYTTAVAGSAPSSSSAFEQISSYEAIATMVLLANEANIANFIFKDGILVSQDYLDNGRGILLDGKAGNIRAFSGKVGAFIIEEAGHLYSYNGSNSIRLRGPGNYPQNKPLIKLDIDGSTIRLGKTTSIVNDKPQDDYIFYVDSEMYGYFSRLRVSLLHATSLRINPSSIPSYSSSEWKPLYVNVNTGAVNYRD